MEVIIKRKGSIFGSNCEALVNPVNCVGVMGAGLAKQFKERYPINFKHYRLQCDNNKLELGGFTVTINEKEKTIVNLATKDHYNEKSNKNLVLTGFENVINNILYGNRLYRINSIAFPMIGCGLGGLNKKEILNRMLNILKIIDKNHGYNTLKVEIYYL